jgi:hypothetical protein
MRFGHKDRRRDARAAGVNERGNENERSNGSVRNARNAKAGTGCRKRKLYDRMREYKCI